jgi:hypothetical protein
LQDVHICPNVVNKFLLNFTKHCMSAADEKLLEEQ